MNTLLELHLYRGASDKRARSVIWIFPDHIQCMEPHDTGTRIQFTLGEPSLYVAESPDEVIAALSFINKTTEEQQECLKQHNLIPFPE
jgi:ribosomal protein L16/L10AE